MSKLKSEKPCVQNEDHDLFENEIDELSQEFTVVNSEDSNFLSDSLFR
jgi:hypothetical protein